MKDSINPTRPIGLGMLIAFHVVILASLTWYFGKREQQQINPNQALPEGMEHTTVVLQKNTYDQYVFSGKVNGKPANFLVDTGANSVVVSSQLASKVGMPTGRQVRVETASGYTFAWRSQIERIDIGSIRLNKVAALINPEMPSDQVLLGMTALQHINFSQEDDKLVLTYKK